MLCFLKPINFRHFHRLMDLMAIGLCAVQQLPLIGMPCNAER
jgi:hypothetical protein